MDGLENQILSSDHTLLLQKQILRWNCKKENHKKKLYFNTLLPNECIRNIQFFSSLAFEVLAANFSTLV